MAYDQAVQAYEQAGKALNQICPICKNVLGSEMCDLTYTRQPIPLWMTTQAAQLYWIPTGEVVSEQQLRLKGYKMVNDKWMKLKISH